LSGGNGESQDIPWGASILVYGPKGAGKSWLCNTAPAPRLILDAEAGSRFLPGRKKSWNPLTESPPELDGTWDTVVAPIRDFRALEQAYSWLASGKHPFKSVSLDSASEIQQRAIDNIAGAELMSQQQWGQLLRVISDLFRKFRDLLVHPTNPLASVSMTAMARQKDGQWEPYFQGQAATVVPYFFDTVAYIAPVAQPETGETIHRLYVGTFPGFLTGERVGGCLGSYIDNPSITSMIATVRKYLSEGGG
jgi:AAA domain